MKKVILFSLLILLFSIPSIAEVDKITLANIDATTPPPPPEPDCCLYLTRYVDLPYPESFQGYVDVINKGTGGQPFALVASFALETQGDGCSQIQVDNDYIYCGGSANIDGPFLSIYSRIAPYSIVDKIYISEIQAFDPTAEVGSFDTTSNYLYFGGKRTFPSAQGLVWMMSKSDIGGGHSITPGIELYGNGDFSSTPFIVIEDNFIMETNSQSGSTYDVVYLGDGTQCPSWGSFTGNGACWTSPTNCLLGSYTCEAHDWGVWFGPGSTCAGTTPPNPFPTGACCASDGTCEDTTAGNCGATKYFGGKGTSCFENPCTTGSCCNVDATCSVGTFEDCATNLGIFRGSGTTCTLPSGKGRTNSIALKTCYPPTGACVKPSVNSCSMMTLQQCYQQSSYPEASQGQGLHLWGIAGGWFGHVGTSVGIVSGAGNDCGDEIQFSAAESFVLGKYDKIEIPGIFELGIIYLIGGGSNAGEFHTWYWDIMFPLYPFRARSGGYCSGTWDLVGNTWYDFDSNYIYMLDAYEHKIKVLHKLATVFGDPSPVVDSYSYNATAYPWENIAASK